MSAQGSAAQQAGGHRVMPAAAIPEGTLIWLIALFLVVLFAFTAQGFLSVFNLANILREGVLVGFIAVGLTPVIISGNIDLSVGSVIGLAACLSVGLQPFGLVPALIAALLAGTAVGLVNGLLVEKAGINAFIVTLATLIGVRGLTFFYTGDQSLSASDPRFLELGALSIGPVPGRVILLAVLALAVGLMLRATAHGRYTYAIGGNRQAALDAGIPVSRHVIANMVLCGLVAALCGIAMASELGAALPSYGRDYELWAITAVVLGGTRLRGGTGSITGTIGAVLALTILRNGMNLAQVPSFYIPIVMGLALLAALLSDRRPGRLAARGGGE